jgi:hypothetical protein
LSSDEHVRYEVRSVTTPEANPHNFQPFGGFADDAVVEDGSVRPPDAPGIGFETRSDLIALFRTLSPDAIGRIRSARSRWIASTPEQQQRVERGVRRHQLAEQPLDVLVVRGCTGASRGSIPRTILIT